MMRTPKLLAVSVPLLMLWSGAPAQNVTNQPAVLSAAGGRFVFGQISEYGKDQFMLDTQSGRLWVVKRLCDDVSKPETCGPQVLIPVKYQSPHPGLGYELQPEVMFTAPQSQKQGK